MCICIQCDNAIDTTYNNQIRTLENPIFLDICYFYMLEAFELFQNTDSCNPFCFKMLEHTLPACTSLPVLGQPLSLRVRLVSLAAMSFNFRHTVSNKRRSASLLLNNPSCFRGSGFL